MSDFVVLQRTQSEINVFGGDVYVDIDGKNVGIVQRKNMHFDLSPGEHTIKMYKSHTMGSFIGVAETTVEIGEDEKLYARYSAPLMFNQPGNIVIASYNTDSELDNVVSQVERSVHTDFTEQQIKIEQTRKESEKNNTNLLIWIIAVPSILGIIYWIIAMSYIWK